MKAFVAMGAVLALLALPGAMAVVSSNDFTGPLGAAVEPLGMGDAFGALPIYYLNDDGSLWQESNSLAGLQTSAVFDENGVQIAGPDTLVSSTPGAPGTPGTPEVPAMPELPALPGL
jgi:hypothetical protein